MELTKKEIELVLSAIKYYVDSSYLYPAIGDGELKYEKKQLKKLEKLKNKLIKN